MWKIRSLYEDHNADGSLKPGVKSFDSPKTDTNPSGNASQTKPPSGKVSFNMVKVSKKSQDLMTPVGLLLDDGAPYSGIGLGEFLLVQKMVCPKWKGKFDGLPETVRHRPFWQYGVSSHSSKIPWIKFNLVIYCSVLLL